MSADVIANLPPYHRCRSSVIYDHHVRGRIAGVKYSERLDPAPWLANWMVAAGSALLKDAPVIIPVPRDYTVYPRRYN